MQPDRTAPVLEVRDLWTEFRSRRSQVAAVNGVSFTAAAGECLGLVGESGCGKSTTGLSVLRLLPPAGRITSGTVTVDGRDLLTLPEGEMRQVRGNDVAMIFQDPMTSLNPTMTVGKLISRPLRVHWHLSEPAARKRTLELLNRVGMPRAAERLDAYPHQLSGGLRQRVMIAMALACEPKVLIADEPTTALDVTIQAQILDLLDELRDQLGMAMILITHDMGIIAERTQRVVVLYAGRIAESARTAEFFAGMAHPYSEALVRSIPTLGQDARERLYSIPGAPPDLSQPIRGCAFRPRCPRALPECAAEDPPLAQSGADGHLAACFNPVGSGDRGDSTAAAVPAGGHAGRPARSDGELAQRPVLLRCEHVVKEFPVTSGFLLRQVGTVQAVSDVSVSLRVGETFGLVGESGCGKTTLGRMIVGLERPTSGQVFFADEATSGMTSRQLRRRRKEFQLVFQDPYSSLDPRMRIGSTIREPLVIQSVGRRAEQWGRVEELVREVGLPKQAVSRFPHEFSGGQRQRVGIARALILAPSLVVADEPVSALDVSIQAQVLNLLKTLQERHDLTLLVISHDLAVVKYMADTIGVMYLGKLVEIGPAQAIYESAAHHYTRGLIDALPLPDPRRKRAQKQAGVQGEIPSALAPPSGCRFRTRCPAAQDICAEREPPLRAFGPQHLAACHFPLQEPVG